MIDLKSVRDRLDALGIFLSVEDTVSAGEAIEQFNAPPPAAFVSTARESAAGNTLATSFRQKVTQTVSVLWVVGAERATRDNNDPMEEIRSAIIRDLTGWTPEGSASRFEYMSYSLRFIGEGLIWGEALFAGSYYITA